MYLWLLDDKSFIRSPHKRFYLKQNYPDILSEFDSISFKESLPFFQLFWHFLQEDYELKLGLCPVCGKRCDFLFTRLKGYRKHCSFECYQSDAESKHTAFEEMKKTNIIKYGSPCSLCNKEVKIKRDLTWNEKYGGHPIKNDIIKAKQRETNLSNHGGVWNSKTKKCKEKYKKTCIEKYGVENYTQTRDFAIKRKKKIEYDGISFDSSWEIIVYKYCKKQNYSFEFQPNIKLKYIYDNIVHYYQPDFLINNKLYEVKGEQFFDGAKMICPYNRNDYLDGIAEAKHQCMLKNNVTILRKNDIEKIKEML